MGQAARRTSGDINFLKTAFIGLAGVLSFQAFQRFGDEAIRLSNRLKQLSDSTEQQNLTFERQFDVAQETRSSIEATSQLYFRVARSTDQLGLSQERLLAITRGVNQSFKIFGNTADETNAAIVQFSQGLAAGALRGDELRSVLEQAPRLGKAIAAGLTETQALGEGVQVLYGDLRRLGEEGELSAERVVLAIESQLDTLDAEFKKTVPTISEGFVILQNSIVRLFREERTLVQPFAQLLIFLGENFDIVARAALTAATAVGSIFAARALKQATTAVNAFTLSLLRNPLALIATVAIAAASSLIFFSDKIVTVEDDLSTAGDESRTLRDQLSGVAAAASFVADTAFTKLGDAISGIAAKFGTDIPKGIEGLKAAFVSFLRFTGEVVVKLAGLWRGTKNAIVASFENLPDTLGFLMTEALNASVRLIQFGINEIVRVLNASGLFDVQEVQLPQLANAFQSTGDSIGTAFTDGIASAEAETRAFLDEVVGVFDAATTEAAEARRIAEAFEDITGGGGPQVNAKALDDATKAFEKLENSLYPIIAAQRELAEGEKILTDAMQFGLVTAERAAEIREELTESRRDELDPRAAVLRAIREENELLSLNTEEREMQEAVTKALADAGLEMADVSAEFLGTLRAEIRLRQQLNEWQERNTDNLERQKEIYDEIRQPIDGYQNAIRDVLEAQERFNLTMAETNLKLVQVKNEFGQANFIEGFIYAFDEATSAGENFAQSFGQTFGDVLGGLTAGIGEATAQAILFGESFSEAIGDLARNAIAKLIGALIDLGIQFLIQKTIGMAASTAATAAGAAQGAALATAYAPAAAAVSLASFGANAAPAAAGISATYGLTQALARIGLKDGGLVRGPGSSRSDSIDAALSDGEFVVNAASTSRNLPALKAINNGQNVSGAAPMQAPNVTVPVNIVNVTDPQQALAALGTEAGTQVIMNAIEQNSRQVAQIIQS